MAAPPPRKRTRRERMVRVVRARPRLFIAAALGLVVIALLPGNIRVATRMLGMEKAGCQGRSRGR